MTPEEYVQLKAFARIDGALLFLLWIGSFALYIKGMENPILGTLSLILLFVSPFYACLLYTSPSPRDKRQSRMPSSA